jgi:PmbA protein
MDYMELAQQVVRDAAGDGREVEVIITDTKETEIKVSRREVEKLSQSGSRGMGVRVIQNGQTGYAYTSDFSPESIAETWQTAVDLAQITTPDEYRMLPEPQPIPDDDLEIWDASFANVSTEQKIEAAKAIERSALDYDERVVVTTMCTYADVIGHTYMANSKGFAGDYGQTMCYGLVMPIAQDENGAVAGTAFRVATRFDEFDPETIGRDGAKKAVMMLGGQPVTTQHATVVLDHFVGAQVLFAFAMALSADAWQRNRSFLIGQMGEEIGSAMVTLMDNGRMKGGLASAPFDGEGVPTQATKLIDEGVLQNLIYDSYTAAKDGVISTGNATRAGHRALPSLGPSNFYMQPGYKSPEEIIAGVDNGFYVLNVMQTGGIDPITGDCSMSANGVWIKDGKLTDPVGGVTIATTLGEFLRNVSDVGNDLQQIPFMGALGVPTLRVDNMRIGGVES